MDPDPRLTVETAESVYPPSEDTYLLLRALDVRPGERVLELGTGTGLVAIHAAKVARVLATDVNPEAVRLARRNAEANGVALAVVRCDLFRGLQGTFDAIAFNPPYLAERIGGDWKERAWAGGESGEEVALRFLEEAGEHLAAGGRAVLIAQRRQTRVLAAAEERYAARVAAKEALFFEELVALELRHRQNEDAITARPRGSRRSAPRRARPRTTSPSSRTG